MRRRGPKKNSVHIHRDLAVTPERVDAFGQDTRETQLRVLASLRGEIAGDTTNIEYAIAGLILAFLAMVAAPSQTLSLDGVPLWASLTFGLLLGIALVVVLTPFIVPQARRHNRRERATVWLAAFEDEIDRRRTMDGKDGRAWRRTH